VIPSFIGGGAERVFLNILSHIDKSKYEVNLAVGVLEGAYVKYLPSCIIVHELGRKQASRSMLSLLRLVWKLKPDIVFSTLGFVISSSFISILFPKKTKLIARFGNTVSAYLAEVKKNSYLNYLFKYLINHTVFYFADAVVVQSEHMSKDVVSLFSLKGKVVAKIIKVNNPVDLVNIHKLAADISVDYNRVYDLSGPRFLSVGRFDWQKGFDGLLRAFAVVQKKFPNATLIILGDGDGRAQLELLRSDLHLDSQVFLPGFIDNPYPTLSNTDIFVSSSLYEGFSNVILESLVLGVPVVATDCPSGVRELIKEGKNGWLVNMEGDLIENLSSTMLYALSQYKNLDMEAEKLVVTSKYGIDEISIQYEKLYQSLLC
jgi:glycosyltransferase involved in cell wall biosynthesis